MRIERDLVIVDYWHFQPQKKKTETLKKKTKKREDEGVPI